MVKASSLLMIITFIPLLFTEGMRTLLGISPSLLLLVRGLDMLLLCLLIFKKRQKVSLPAKILLAIYLTIFFSATLHGTLLAVLSTDFVGFVMCIAFEYWLRNYYEKTICFLSYTLAGLVLINLALLIICPEGLYAATYKFDGLSLASFLRYNLNWLFGYKNDQFGYLLPFLGIVSIYSYRKKGRLTLKCKVLFFVCLLSEYLAQATMATLLTLFFIIVMLLFVNQNKDKLNKIILSFINLRFIIISVSIVVIATVIFNSNNFIADNLIKISIALGKDATFNGRTNIWLTAIEYIKDSPIIGYGNIDSVDFIEKSGILGGTHAHNYILHIMIRGGLICLIEHIILYVITIKKCLIKKGFVSYTIGLVLGIFFIDGITAINMYYALFNALFILAYYAIEFDNRNCC